MVSDPLDVWNSYFSGVAATAAALLAIAFLTFQVRADIWKRNLVKQAVAWTTLVELSAPVLFGLLFLIPHHHWHVAGIIVGISGYGVMLAHAIIFLRARKMKTVDKFDKNQMWGMPITFVTFSIFLFVPFLSWKAYTCLWMIISGFSEAWIFLRPQGDEGKVVPPKTPSDTGASQDESLIVS
jgi:phosphatidylserine synthase